MSGIKNQQKSEHETGRKEDTHKHTHTHISQLEDEKDTHPPTQAHTATVKCQATFTRVDKYEASSCGSQAACEPGGVARRGVAGGNGKRQHIERFNVLSAWALLGPSPTNPPRVLVLILLSELRPLRPSACLASGVAALPASAPLPPPLRATAVNLNILWGVSIVDVGAIVSATLPEPP